MDTLEARSLEGPFASAQISHADIADFAVECVNLNREDAQEYREQVVRLRDKLDKYAADHPDYGLIKTLLSGSLAKGTALKVNESDAHGSLLRLLLQQFAEIGYRVDCYVVNVVNYGAPQIRERLICIGNRHKLVSEFPQPRYSNRQEDVLVSDNEGSAFFYIVV